MRNLNIGVNTNCPRLNDMFSDCKKFSKYLFVIIWMLKLKKIATFLRTMTWYIFILILLRHLQIKATNSDLEKNLGFNIDEKLIENINDRSLYINYPENICALYEINIFLSKLKEDKKDILYKFLACFQNLLVSLDELSLELKDREINIQYDIIKKIIDKFHHSKSSLTQISFAKLNNFQNEFSTPELFLDSSIKLKQYDHIYKSIIIKKIILIANFVREYQKNEKSEKICEIYMKPFYEICDLMESEDIDSSLRKNFEMFVYESFNVILEIINLNKKAVRFINNLSEFQTERISFLIKEIKARKYNFNKTVLTEQRQKFIVEYYQLKFRKVLAISYEKLYKSEKKKNYKYALCIEFLTLFFQKYNKIFNKVNKHIYNKNICATNYEDKKTSKWKLLMHEWNNIIKEHENPTVTFSNQNYRIKNLYNNSLNMQYQRLKLLVGCFYNYLKDNHILYLYLLKETGDTNVVSKLFNSIQEKIVHEINDFFKDS